MSRSGDIWKCVQSILRKNSGREALKDIPCRLDPRMGVPLASVRVMVCLVKRLHGDERRLHRNIMSVHRIPLSENGFAA